MLSVTIGRHRVGPGQPTLVVAEAGVNHNGCLETALRLVDVAADCGADAVKFQLFRAEDLATPTAPTTRYQEAACGERSLRAMLARLELSPGQFQRIKEHCDRRSILFLATPFSERDLIRLLGLGTAAIKIASTDLTNGRLLERAAVAGPPIILSTGASTAEEIHSAVDALLRAAGSRRLILLHCVSCYPTPIEAVNLGAISTLQRTFVVPCGLSDHTTSTRVGAWAVAAGACLLEKHFTLDPNAEGPDHGMSLDPDRLAQYIAAIRQAEQAMGDGNLGLRDLEAEVRAAAGKSVVSAVPLDAGTRLTSEMLALKRPGTGIPPQELGRLVGRRTSVRVPCDTVLSWDMLE